MIDFPAIEWSFPHDSYAAKTIELQSDDGTSISPDAPKSVATASESFNTRSVLKTKFLFACEPIIGLRTLEIGWNTIHALDPLPSKGNVQWSCRFEHHDDPSKLYFVIGLATISSLLHSYNQKKSILARDHILRREPRYYRTWLGRDINSFGLVAFDGQTHTDDKSVMGFLKPRLKNGDIVTTLVNHSERTISFAINYGLPHLAFACSNHIGFLFNQMDRTGSLFQQMDRTNHFRPATRPIPWPSDGQFYPAVSLMDKDITVTIVSDN